MKIDVKVKNLGKIKEAEFKIRPMTVITGPNGTGKSFFTKSLYSILNVINKNVYHESVNKTIRQLRLQLQTLLSSVSYVGQNDLLAIEEIELGLNRLQSEFDEVSDWKINDYFTVTTQAINSWLAAVLLTKNSRKVTFLSIFSDFYAKKYATAQVIQA